MDHGHPNCYSSGLRGRGAVCPFSRKCNFCTTPIDPFVNLGFLLTQQRFDCS